MKERKEKKRKKRSFQTNFKLSCAFPVLTELGSKKRAQTIIMKSRMKSRNEKWK